MVPLLWLDELFTSRLYKANSFEISEKDLKEVLKFDENAPFSYLTRQITRSEKDLSQYYMFKFSVNKASKSIYFVIEEKRDWVLNVDIINIYLIKIIIEF